MDEMKSYLVHNSNLISLVLFNSAVLIETKLSAGLSKTIISRGWPPFQDIEDLCTSVLQLYLIPQHFIF